MSRKEALSQFINQIHGRPVVVKLNSGVDYRGECVISLVVYLGVCVWPMLFQIWMNFKKIYCEEWIECLLGEYCNRTIVYWSDIIIPKNSWSCARICTMHILDIRTYGIRFHLTIHLSLSQSQKGVLALWFLLKLTCACERRKPTSTLFAIRILIWEIKYRGATSSVTITTNTCALQFSSICLLSLSSFTGVLACLDGYMNIALDQTEEYANGQLKNKYGDAFIRGNNVLYISTQKRRV